MKDIKKSITYKDEEYPVLCDLNVLEAIQEEFGTLTRWGELTDGEGGEPNIGAIITGFTLMINEGIEEENAEKNTSRAPVDRKKVGRIITELGFAEAVKLLNRTVIESTKDEEAEKN